MIPQGFEGVKAVAAGGVRDLEEARAPEVRLAPAGGPGGSARVYDHPWATVNQTMALARARLARVRTRSQPLIGLAAASWRTRRLR